MVSSLLLHQAIQLVLVGNVRRLVELPLKSGSEFALSIQIIVECFHCRLVLGRSLFQPCSDTGNLLKILFVFPVDGLVFFELSEQSWLR